MWTEKQQNAYIARLDEKRIKGRQHRLYVHKLLDSCKTWKGPCTTVNELYIVLAANPDNVENIVKTELSYYKHTHPSDVAARPELFKLLKVSHK